MTVIEFPEDPDRCFRRQALAMIAECRSAADEARFMVQLARTGHNHVRVLRHSCQALELEYYAAGLERLLQERQTG